MSPGILGKKIGMTQVFRPDGQVVPVTVLKAGPCVVVQRKTPATDGYDAVQLGFMEYAKKSSMSKPAAGHLKKSGAEGVRFQREFRLEEGTNGRSEGGRPRAGGRVQAPGQSGRDRHQQGPWLCGRGEAPSLPRRRRDARVDVPSRAGIDRRLEFSVARFPGMRMGGTDGHGRG
jgi:hypothetical protein